MKIMLDDDQSWDAWCEGLNFSVQTLTTVGYGNWETPVAWSSPSGPTDAVKQRRLKQMRKYSLFFMGMSATAYCVFTGLVVAAIVEVRSAHRA